MEDWLEALLSLLLEGSMAGATSRRMPVAVRVVLAVFLFVILGGACAFFLWITVAMEGHWGIRLLLLAVGLMLAFYLMRLARGLLRR